MLTRNQFSVIADPARHVAPVLKRSGKLSGKRAGGAFEDAVWESGLWLLPEHLLRLISGDRAGRLIAQTREC